MLGLMNNDVGGYAQGPMQSGAAGVPQTGITWNDITKAALQYGSKPGSSGAMFAGLTPGAQQSQQVGTIQQLSPEKKEQDSTGMLVKALMSYFLL